MPLEELHGALVLLRGGSSRKRSEVAPAAGPRVGFARVQTVATRLQLANHLFTPKATRNSSNSSGLRDYSSKDRTAGPLIGFGLAFKTGIRLCWSWRYEMTSTPRSIAGATLLGLAAVAALSAQTPPPKSPPVQDATTITGCLVQGPSKAEEQFFVRTPAIAVPAGTPITVGGDRAASGRATTSVGSPDATTAYRITGLTSAQLKPHVGHRIELQGRLSHNTPPGTTATTKQDPKTGRASTSVTDDWTIAGELHATTIKMVAASCQ
jgi:hypothetical protein